MYSTSVDPQNGHGFSSVISYPPVSQIHFANVGGDNQLVLDHNQTKL
jgi:hypothetical protein